MKLDRFLQLFGIYKEYTLDEEFGLIHDEFIRKMVSEILLYAPKYFWVVPASSTGKYHPKYVLGKGGLIRHVKATIKIAQELFRMEDYSFYNKEKDMIIGALILHDMFKHGTYDSGYTVSEHPILIADFIRETYCTRTGNILRKDDMDEWLERSTTAETMARLVERHMGQWNTDYKTKKEILPKPETEMEKFVHLCDYLASRKCLEVIF
jgi:hypothetical protein